jgi:succinate dehydrogenase / fumarate reductase cytochrome b subunit
MDTVVGFYRSTLGKKVLMAVTGILLFLYLVAHMLGNLQIFMGPEQINKYAELLHSSAAVLWGARLVLLFCVGVHIVAAVQVWLRSRSARPVKYKVFKPRAADGQPGQQAQVQGSSSSAPASPVGGSPVAATLVSWATR